ncbi:increased DNA methylation 3-like [Magnolia sinica]|uniref:increased DNA methylation 3-like n=1 Tax=Magnolia sinica TaxID=86752 RepID=UPI002658EB74|nr:increased DNA methylation 3-like [Magnolia sinica]XP_058070457.1 increased DNA methylation 3-like [Magnolia sinica]
MDSVRPISRLSVEASTNDQCFLVNFIMGTYLGPDVKTDIPRRSASQRIAEGLPPYDITDLGAAFLKLSEVESLYYYILRNAHPSAVLKLQSLYMYFKGDMHPSNSDILEDERQFTSFFPRDIHRQGRFKGSFKIFKGVVMIGDPDVSYIKPADLERFRWLAGVNDLKIDRDEALFYHHGYRTDRDESQPSPNYTLCYAETSTKDVPNGNAAESSRRRNNSKKRRVKDPLLMPTPCQSAAPLYDDHVAPPFEEAFPVKAIDLAAPAMVVLASTPRIEHWNPKTSVFLTGTAKDGTAGPPVGLVDIGISKDAYLFRVALPGVKKDQCQFSCEIEFDGKVQLQGLTTTGERVVMRHSRVFQMTTQHLCPPGPFTISFRLPGPVDPRLFTANFGSDGILEAIVMKYREPKVSGVQVHS